MASSTLFRGLARIGAKTGKEGSQFGKHFTKAVGQLGWQVGKLGFKGGIMGAQLGAKAGLFAMRHPLATAGMIGAGMGLASLAGSDIPESTLTAEQRMDYVQRRGSSYIDQELQDSAHELVFGLHNGRHK